MPLDLNLFDVFFFFSDKVFITSSLVTTKDEQGFPTTLRTYWGISHVTHRQLLPL